MSPSFIRTQVLFIITVMLMCLCAGSLADQSVKWTTAGVLSEWLTWCGYWEPNSGPLPEQWVLRLTGEIVCQPHEPNSLNYSFGSHFFLFCFICFACTYICTICIIYFQRPKRGHRIPWKWSTGVCKPPRSCWELNPGPLKEQPVLLTTEPSLQPLIIFLCDLQYVYH